MALQDPGSLNAFCVDLEEWFHVGFPGEYADVSTWDAAPSSVERETHVLLDLLAEHGHKGTFLTVGWLAAKYPGLMRTIAAQGHEIGCHGYFHRVVWQQTPDEFREEISRSRKLLQDLTGQPVLAFRAPCFSMKEECFWAYEILVEEGITIDVSVVPAARDNGGVLGFRRDPLELHTRAGGIIVFPVSVMSIFGKTTQFSGGGHMRLLPTALIDAGFRQNHREGRPVMAYIHPREVNPHHPRIKMPPLKAFKSYVGMDTVQPKLRHMMRRYRFGTLSQVLARYPDFPSYDLRPEGGRLQILPTGAAARA